jgi:hypothetical protein
MVQALALDSLETGVLPTPRVLAVDRPDRVLLLMVDDDLVAGVLFIVPGHGSLLFRVVMDAGGFSAGSSPV